MLEHNLMVVLKMQVCTVFNPLLTWREQLTPLLGQEEVDRLDIRLKQLNITGKRTILI